MANSSILIEFNSGTVSLGQRVVLSSSELAFNLEETASTTRYQSNQFSLSPNASSPSVMASNLATALNFDYQNLGLFQVTYSPLPANANKILITAFNPGVTFAVVSNTISTTTVTVSNEAAPNVFNFTALSFAAATVNPVCSYIKVKATTSFTADSVSSPVLIPTNTANPIEFEYPRGGEVPISVQSLTVAPFGAAVFPKIPDALSVGNVTIDVLEAPGGATVTIDVLLPTPINPTGGVLPDNSLSLQYSLDNVTYQTSNVFTGLFVNTYTLYVKDQYGCTINKAFAVLTETPGLAVTEPFVLMPKTNSIRSAKRITSTPCGNYQNNDTLLSCEEIVANGISYKAIQKYNSCDLVRLQFKSNYDNITVKTIDELGNEIVLPIIKITDNLEREDRRDAIITNLGGGKTGVYFTSGTTYDYFTGFTTGTYTLNGNLPEYGEAGTYVEIAGWGTHLIQEVVFKESLNARVLVFDFIYTSGNAVLEVKSRYSVANFEIYEFDIDMSFYINKHFCISVAMTHPLAAFDDVNYLSEDIYVEVEQSVINPTQLVYIEYYNTSNGEILYLNDEGEIRIKNKIRREVESISIADNSNSEVQNTDTTTILLNANIYDGDEFEFSPQPTEMARHLVRALTHNVVTINGLGYIIEDVPETERLGNSNLYTVKAKMIRTGEVYNTAIEGIGNEVPDEQEVVKLLNGNLGFIKAE